MTTRLSLLTCLFTLSSLSLWAQITYTANSFPSAGQVLHIATAIDSTLAVTPASSTATAWDFTTLQSINNRKDTIQAASTGASFALFPTSDILSPLLGGGFGVAYADVTTTQLVNIGGGVELFGLSIAAPYVNTHVRQVVPLTYGDNATDQYILSVSRHVDSIPLLRQLLDSLTSGSPVPINPDSIRLRLTGDEDRAVDAWGTCQLPDSTIYDVIRQKVVTDFEVRIEIGSQVPIFGFRWVDLTTIVPLPFPTQGRLVRYDFLAEGIPQPVVQLTLDSSEANIINIEYLDSTNNNPIQVRQVQNQALLPMAVYPNPAQTQLTVEVPLQALTQPEATLTLTNALGQVVWQRPAQGQMVQTIGVAALPRGMYTLALSTQYQGQTRLQALQKVVLQ